MSDYLYKGKPVKFLSMAYTYAGKQYCTIVIVNAAGKKQRQTVQFCKLVEVHP